MQTNTAHRYGPWQCKQRADGAWVVEQFNFTTGRIHRWPPFTTEAEARQWLADLTGQPVRCTTSAQ
jgi:hypothetical protein